MDFILSHPITEGFVALHPIGKAVLVWILVLIGLLVNYVWHYE